MFSFSRALHLMRYGGKKVRRAEWEKDSYIEIRPCGFELAIQVNGRGFITVYDSRINSFIVGTADILAMDWEIYE